MDTATLHPAVASVISAQCAFAIEDNLPDRILDMETGWGVERRSDAAFIVIPPIPLNVAQSNEAMDELQSKFRSVLRNQAGHFLVILKTKAAATQRTCKSQEGGAMNLPARVISVDFEATGLNYMFDHPMALSLAVIDQGEPTGELLTLPIRVPTKAKLSMEALDAQGLNPYDAVKGLIREIRRIFPKDAYSQKDAMWMVADWVNQNGLRGTPCIAYKASFDLGFYDYTITRNTSVYEGSPLGPIWICVKQLAQSVFPDAGRGNYSLDKVAALLKVPGRDVSKNGHDAQEDALLCGRVYEALRLEVERRASVQVLDLMDALKLGAGSEEECLRNE